MTQLEIEAFLAVAKYNTLSAAAQKLFITQPALTRRIQTMEEELYDLAFIAIQDYTQPMPAGTQIRPAYSEAFVAVSFSELPNTDGRVTVSSLDPGKEVLLRWNKEFMAWHRARFDETVEPVVILEYFSLSRYFLTGDAWMFTPYVTGLRFAQMGAHMYDVADGPPNQIIYCLTNNGRKEAAIQRFLDMLDRHLRTMPPDKVQSFRE